MKIIKEETQGLQRVYDIGVPYTHNFLLANKTISHNCFNKCLAEGQEIQTIDGKSRIEAAINKEVLIWLTDQQVISTAKVLEVIPTGMQEVYSIELDGIDIPIICTLDHQFLCRDQKYHTVAEIIDNQLDIITI